VEAENLLPLGLGAGVKVVPLVAGGITELVLKVDFQTVQVEGSQASRVLSLLPPRLTETPMFATECFLAKVGKVEVVLLPPASPSPVLGC